MPAYRDPTPRELEESRDARVARQELDRLEISTHYLQQALGLQQGAGGSLGDHVELAKLVEQTAARCRSLNERCVGRVESRRRPKNRPARAECTLYLDECGQHEISASDPFRIFVLAGVIVQNADEPANHAIWDAWKKQYLGAEDVVIHEPDVRRRRPPFRGEGGEAAITALPAVLAQLKFRGLVVAINRDDYLQDFGSGPLDASLPAHAYMMVLDFLMERAALILDGQFEGATARVVVESRGSKEDALLQHEFTRLHLEGTSYVSPQWFRQQLHPGIAFYSKADNKMGLQLADLLARPVGEKVKDPNSDPDRWQVFRHKLCAGNETKNSILGLKILPWRDRYGQLWNS